MSFSEKDLEKKREAIDRVDDNILSLLKERHDLVDEIADIKQELGLEAYQPGRYHELLNALAKKAKKLGLDTELVFNVWKAIHHSSLAQQGDQEHGN